MQRPESVQRMPTKHTSIIAELRMPPAKSTAISVAMRASSAMRWSGLSAPVSPMKLSW